jgi:hypothetical protein
MCCKKTAYILHRVPHCCCLGSSHHYKQLNSLTQTLLLSHFITTIEITAAVKRHKFFCSLVTCVNMTFTDRTKRPGERYPTKAQGHCKQFLLCSINYPNIFRLPNAIFRGLHFPFISYSSLLVCISGGYGLLFTRCGHLLRNV